MNDENTVSPGEGVEQSDEQPQKEERATKQKRGSKAQRSRVSYMS